MREYLPGNLQERLRELREANGYATRQELADVLGIDKSTYGRMENGATKTVSSDILIKLADLYNVSTDYILGISDVPERTYYDIGELGLSVKSAGNLYEKKADPRVVNELLMNEKFLVATRQLATYFSDVASVAFQSCNALYDFSFDLTTEMIDRGRLPKDKDMTALRKQLKACKVPAESFQLTRIENQIMSAVREIKKKVAEDVKEHAGKDFTSEILGAVKEEFAGQGEMCGLSYEEKMECVSTAVKIGIRKNTKLTEEEIQQMDRAIEKMLPELVNLWKNN